MDTKKPSGTPPVSPVSPLAPKLPLRTAPLPRASTAAGADASATAVPMPTIKKPPVASTAARVPLPMPTRNAAPGSAKPGALPMRARTPRGTNGAPSPALGDDLQQKLPTPQADGWVPLSSVPSAADVTDHLVNVVEVEPDPRPAAPVPASMHVPHAMAAASSPLLARAITLPPPAPLVSLTLPPSPTILRAPRPPRAPANWRLIGGLSGSAFATVLVFLGAAWAYRSNRTPEGTNGPALGADVLPPTLASRVFATGLGVQRQPVASVSRRGGRGSAFFAAHDTGMNARMAALPPPRRSTMVPAEADPVPSASGPDRVIIPAPGQTCGERCAGDVDCLLACRPRAASTGGGGLSTSVPSGEQLQMAQQGVRGAVMVCGMSLPGNAPATARVQVTFGASGSVSHASVGGAYAGTPVGECVGRAVERARVPSFTQSNFSTSWTLTVH